ncbi:MAG: FAD-dependent oxidoreductase [Pseudobacteriovorax sp.]|nr:FAD-dependent oxidoreductase [Pseudobacteriovorax sp.]
MAKSHQATVLSLLEFPHHNLLEIKVDDLEAINYAAGKYIIVNSGMNPGLDKLHKRAYTLMPIDADRFYLAAARVDNGFGSHYINSLKVSDRIEFSGCWGKFTLDESVDSISVVCSDTGITAGMGLLSSQNLKDATCQIYWLRERDRFLSDSFVLEHLQKWASHLEIIDIPAIDNETSRQDLFQSFDVKSLRGQHHFLAGDGLMVTSLREKLEQNTVDPANIKQEIFFRKPPKT